MHIKFIFKLISRLSLTLVFLAVLTIALGFAIILLPELLAALVAFGLIVFGFLLLILALWLKKFSKINFKL